MENKQLVLCCGLPGSGKSYSSVLLKEACLIHGLRCEIHSTDNYFMVNDNYIFDRDKLHENHVKNQRAVEKDMISGVGCIIVDNTNTKKKDWQVYADLAKQFGYSISFLKSPSPWADDPEECFKRNTHGVPLETIQRMLEQMKADEVNKKEYQFI